MITLNQVKMLIARHEHMMIQFRKPGEELPHEALRWAFMVTPEEMEAIVDEYMALPAEERDPNFTSEHATRCKNMQQSFNIGFCRIFPEFPPPEFIEAVFGKGSVN